MKNLTILDCTLRDGGNVVGNGFSADLTKMMIEGLIKSNIKLIEMGNSHGIGSYEDRNSIAPLTDVEYLELVQPYLPQAEIGMFMNVKSASRKNIELAAKYNLKFLRVGANAGDGRNACDAIKMVKENGMKCRYSLMKGYVLSADELAEESKMLADCGLDEITLMDSAGTMLPYQVSEYIAKISEKINIPIGFHGHNNLGLSSANALAAAEAGATVFDTGLMGMARSAGNCATEVAVAVFQRLEEMKYVNLYTLLDFIDNELTPAMKVYGYESAIKPIDLIYGYAGCHSSFSKLFKSVAEQKEVSLYELILEVSKIDKKAPSKKLMEKVADDLKSKFTYKS